MHGLKHRWIGHKDGYYFCGYKDCKARKYPTTKIVRTFP